jgi:hypothetical protein
VTANLIPLKSKVNKHFRWLLHYYLPLLLQYYFDINLLFFLKIYNNLQFLDSILTCMWHQPMHLHSYSAVSMKIGTFKTHSWTEHQYTFCTKCNKNCQIASKVIKWKTRFLGHRHEQRPSFRISTHLSHSVITVVCMHYYASNFHVVHLHMPVSSC